MVPLLAAFGIAGAYSPAFLGAGLATLGLVVAHPFRRWAPVTATLVGDVLRVDFDAAVHFDRDTGDSLRARADPQRDTEPVPTE